MLVFVCKLDWLDAMDGSVAAYDKALTSLHGDMVKQNQQRMGDGALEATLRAAFTSAIPALAQACSSSNASDRWAMRI